ncbi:MAG TPA: hypothetical protein PKV13_05060 [Propionicimonas sp.]|nr:hypothetical protein [Propionicimonas sp.]HRA05971.1 hypothetical protein [Propionicimonas sp.]
MRMPGRISTLLIASALLVVPWTPPAASADSVAAAAAPRLEAPAAGASANLVVATFNVRNANWSSTQPTNSREKSWDTRRAVVVSQIMGEHVDVLGVQEATAANVTDNGPQYLDLVAALNAAGGTYAVTNETRYDGGEECDYVEGPIDPETGESDWTEVCHKIPDPSGDVRIIYNTQRVKLVDPIADQGALALDDRDTRNGSARFMAWARFTDQVTGKPFIFATGHVEPGMSKAVIATRKAQAQKIVSHLNHVVNAENLPIIWGSDLASSKLSPSKNTAYDVFLKEGGFTDPLGNTYKTKKARTKYTYAKKIVNGKYFTLNNFKAAPDKNKRYKMGAHLDYILIKTPGKKATVAQWKQVLYLDKKGAFSGEIPSDHNMVAVTLALP